MLVVSSVADAVVPVADAVVVAVVDAVVVVVTCCLFISVISVVSCGRCYCTCCALLYQKRNCIVIYYEFHSIILCKVSAIFYV